MKGVVLERGISAADAEYAWRDPETWPPKGLGCARCHERPPIIWGLSFGALCQDCLMRCFAGYDFERLVNWLGRMNIAYQRNEERREAIEAWRKGDNTLVNRYKAKYGVDLIA